MFNINKIRYYLYTYSYTVEEESLCQLEMRSLFGEDLKTSLPNILVSNKCLNPDRSPFMKDRLGVIFSGDSIEQINNQVKDIHLSSDETYKVLYIKNPAVRKSEQLLFEKRREIERTVATSIQGQADLQDPKHYFGLINVNGQWYFGLLETSKPVWHYHQKKPHQYSTALSTRVARAVVNIAVPEPEGKRVIDPCCGIGTVVIEALSMGINIIGRDINPLVLPGTRENIAYFGYHCDINFGDMKEINELYDVAIIDMPYNLCSVISSEEKLEMLRSARRFAEKVVVVTIEPLDHILIKANWKIKDRCTVKKGSTFSREVLVCK